MASASSELGYTDFVNILQFVQEWSDVIFENDIVHDSNELLKTYAEREMGVSGEMSEELESVCGVSTLKGSSDTGQQSVHDLAEEKSQMMKTVPDTSKLVSTGLMKAALNNHKHRKYTVANLKYRMDNGPWLHATKSKEVPADHSIQLPEALITVNVYRPLVPQPRHSTNKLRIHAMVQVLGCQCLTMLRDLITCHADLALEGDFSNNPDMPQEPLARDVFKSGFFFIENVFYNDMRDLDCRDYSSVIREWAADPAHGIGPYSSRKMEETCFQDLTVRLGQPYLYMHQGNCEHLIVFTDVRLLHPGDSQDLRDYPLATGRSHDKTVTCRACQNFKAVWIVSESPHCPEDPCFMCNSCFRMLHYDEEGNKLGAFKAFPYKKLPSDVQVPSHASVGSSSNG